MRGRILVLLILLTLSVQANPVTGAVSAHTEGDTVRIVVIDVVVENRSDEETLPQLLNVTCTPQVVKDPRNEGTVKDKRVFSEMVPALKPKEKQTVSVRTQYTSKNFFRGQRTQFRALNVDPRREIMVKFEAKLVPPQ